MQGTRRRRRQSYLPASAVLQRDYELQWLPHLWTVPERVLSGFLYELQTSARSAQLRLPGPARIQSLYFGSSPVRQRDQLQWILDMRCLRANPSWVLFADL